MKNAMNFDMEALREGKDLSGRVKANAPEAVAHLMASEIVYFSTTAA